MEKYYSTKQIGDIGEEYSHKYLESKGFLILEKNWRVSRIGEIDIIAKFEEVLCFIEVKTRKNYNFGTPAEAVNKAKMQKIKILSQIYLKNNGILDVQIRFDIVEVLLNTNVIPPYLKKITHLENAF